MRGDFWLSIEFHIDAVFLHEDSSNFRVLRSERSWCIFLQNGDVQSGRHVTFNVEHRLNNWSVRQFQSVFFHDSLDSSGSLSFEQSHSLLSPSSNRPRNANRVASHVHTNPFNSTAASVTDSEP